MSDRSHHRQQGGVAGPLHRYAVSTFDLSSKSSKLHSDHHHHSDLETEEDEEEDSLGYQHGARSNFILRKSRSLYYDGSGVDGDDDDDQDDDQRHARHHMHNSRSHHSPGSTSPPSLKPVECRLLERAKVSTQSPIKVSPKIVDLSLHSFSEHSPVSTPRSGRQLFSSSSSPSSSALCHHTSSMINGNLTLSSSSGCSTQSSVSSSASLGTLSRNGYGFQVQHSRHQNQRSSLREAAQNFRDFVQQYEQSLIECLSSVEDANTGGGTTDGAANEEHPVKREHDSSVTEQDVQTRKEIPEVTGIRRNESSASSPLCRQSLRLQLEEVRRLRDQYETGFRCTEAIEKIEKLSRSRADCAREWRANQRLLVSIEEQLEKLIGIFRIRVDDLEGWARICPRDQYEIEFRHGKQRQVLRVRIGKALERSWDHDRREVTFRGALKPTIVCRMREVKSRWNLWSKRNTTLGVTSISMSELLAAVAKNCPILLDANASGSLKLRIFCTWQPNSSSGEIVLPPPATPISAVSLDHRNRSATMDERQLEKKKMETNSNSLRNDLGLSPKIGINKELARSLLHLPTFYEYRQDVVSNKSDNHEASDLSEEHEDDRASDRRDSAHSTSSNQTDNHEIEEEEAPINGALRSYVSRLSVSVTPDSSRSVSPYPSVHRIENSTKGSRQGTIERVLHNLQSALEDYHGQFVELTMLAITVNRLVELLEEYKPDGVEESSSDSGHRSKTPDSEREIEHALAEFDFLDSSGEDTDEDDGTEGKIIASFENRAIGRAGRVPAAGGEEDSDDDQQADTFVPPQPHHSAQQECESSRHVWSSILLLHLSSALDHLNHVGSWILKSRENAALCRLRVDTFACEQIYEILTKGAGKNQPLGKDVRLRELWDQIGPRSENSQRWVLSTRQLSSHLAQMMSDQVGTSGPLNDSEEDEDIYRNAAQWLVGLIVPPGHSKLTIFDLRAFFELDLWRKSLGPNQHLEPISLKTLFQIALDLIRLVKLKTRKISLYRVEQILFDRFNVNCHWIPSELSLTLICLLYESHSQLERGRNRKSGLTTSEVKKCDRLRELSKTITNWLIWILEEGRFEIREHILSGLESSLPLTRRASCFGMMFLFKLLKRIDDEQHRRRSESSSASGESRSNLNQISLFYGQEMDCLLYVSIEDPDSRVREEARQALKCLGAFGQMRLNQLERSRMGFALSTGSGGGSCKTPTKPYFAPTSNALSSAYFGRSMPNLNLR